MKKYIVGVILSIGILVSPTFTHAAGLTSAQVNAIIGLLQSFGADSLTIANVESTLTGKSPTARPFCHTFDTNLKIGDQGIEVRNISVALSKEGFNRGGNNDWTGFDEAVSAAVVQFQTKYGIRQTGYVGPITRAKLNALYGCRSSQSTQTQNPSQGSLQIDPSSATVKVGDSVTIKAMFTQPLHACVDRGEAKCTPYEIDTSFVSDNPSIAEVSIAHSPIPNCTQSPGVTCMDSHWIIKGVSPGIATISTELDASFPPVIYYLKDLAQRTFIAKMQATIVEK